MSNNLHIILGELHFLWSFKDLFRFIYHDISSLTICTAIQFHIVPLVLNLNYKKSPSRTCRLKNLLGLLNSDLRFLRFELIFWVLTWAKTETRNLFKMFNHLYYFSLTYALCQKVSVEFNLDNVYYQHNPLCTGRGAVVVWDNSAFLRDFSLVYLELAVA